MNPKNLTFEELEKLVELKDAIKRYKRRNNSDI